MTVPNTGDILILSQVAWKISRAFSAGRKHAPQEFQDVETEISGLAKALKLLAESLHADSGQSLVQDADTEIQNGIHTILSSCQRTVNDLDSLIDQYQVTRRHRTVGGFAIERSWSDLVLAEYKTIIWTMEGGNLQNLRDLLQMHTSSVTLLAQALQNQSMSHLKSVVAPMADRIDIMCHSSGGLDQQLDDIRRLLQEPAVAAPPVPMKSPARRPISGAANPQTSSLSPSSPRNPPLRCQNAKISLPRIPQRSESPESPRSPDSNISTATLSSPTETVSASRASSPNQKQVSEFSSGGSSFRYSSSSYASSDTGTSNTSGWPSPGSSREPCLSQTVSTRMTSCLPHTPEICATNQRVDIQHLSLLPPPALGLAPPHQVGRATSQSSSRAKLSPYPSIQGQITMLHRSATTASQKEIFEKEAFRNGAILCDAHGKLVEYSHQIYGDDPRNIEMIRASDECRIAVVRKRVTAPETRLVSVVTSVWAFSDDGTARVELRMDDTQMYIPYSSYFSQNKVSITVPCELRFHDIRHGNRPTRVANTSWVNYVFDTAQAAALFQNELMGRTLLATFRTEKTMRIHEGLGKSFSYAEQMCGLENLRIWEDAESGAIIALIHFSADFRDGYLAFYLNSRVNPIVVKDDGNREVKIRGLRVPIDQSNRTARKDSVISSSEQVNVQGKGKKSKEGESTRKINKEKVISGAKIEFASEMEKCDFLEMCKEMQRTLIDLPDLMGVN